MPRSVLLVLALIVGVAIGIGTFTFVYARGASYLTNDPNACANCHVMSDHFGSWVKSSHHAVAVCNDCHAPHDLIGKYKVKARNGFWHSFYFTTGTFPDPIRITPRNHEVTEHACRSCHEQITQAIDAHSEATGPISCTRCHPNVGHWVR